MASRNRNIAPIRDVIKRRNTKCKRSKNLIKKCYELSVLCDLEININIFERSRGKLHEYCSHQQFNVAAIHEMVESDKNS